MRLSALPYSALTCPALPFLAFPSTTQLHPACLMWFYFVLLQHALPRCSVLPYFALHYPASLCSAPLFFVLLSCALYRCMSLCSSPLHSAQSYCSARSALLYPAQHLSSVWLYPVRFCFALFCSVPCTLIRFYSIIMAKTRNLSLYLLPCSVAVASHNFPAVSRNCNSKFASPKSLGQSLEW